MCGAELLWLLPPSYAYTSPAHSVIHRSMDQVRFDSLSESHKVSL